MVTGPSGINRDLAPTGADRVAGEAGPDFPPGIETGSHHTDVDPRAVTWLAPVLDTLLPANGELPPAGQMGLVDKLLSDARWAPELTEALTWMSDNLPEAFDGLDEDARTAVLLDLEAKDPRAFGGIVNLAYNAYYTDSRVLAQIERESGFSATPPQPGGYELEPFDEAVLSKTREREPFWRNA